MKAGAAPDAAKAADSGGPTKAAAVPKGAEALSALIDPQTLRTLQGAYATGPAEAISSVAPAAATASATTTPWCRPP